MYLSRSTISCQLVSFRCSHFFKTVFPFAFDSFCIRNSLFSCPMFKDFVVKVIFLVFCLLSSKQAPSYLSSLITRELVSRYNLRNYSDVTLLSHPSFKPKATLSEHGIMECTAKRD